MISGRKLLGICCRLSLGGSQFIVYIPACTNWQKMEKSHPLVWYGTSQLLFWTHMTHKSMTWCWKDRHDIQPLVISDASQDTPGSAHSSILSLDIRTFSVGSTHSKYSAYHKTS